MSPPALIHRPRWLTPWRAALVARLALLAVFGAVIYFAGYQPARALKTYADPSFLMRGTIEAANAGHPYMAFDPQVPGRLIRLSDFASGYYDAGPAMLVSTTAVIGNLFDAATPHASDATIYDDILVVLLVTGCVLLLPGIPLPIGVGALVALGASAILAHPSPLAFSLWFWGSTYAAVVVTVVVVLAPLPGLTPARLAAVSALGVLAALAQFLRHEAAVIVLAGCGALCVLAWIGWAASRTRPALETARRATLCGGLVVALSLAAPLAARAGLALAWHQSYAETSVALHGAGHSLYLGLGYIGSPYNISWRDQVMFVNGKVIAPTIRFEDAAFQSVMLREWARLVQESPWLLLDNIGTKTGALLRELSFLGSWPVIKIALPLSAVLLATALLRAPSLELTLASASALGVAAFGLAPPLLIHPDYTYWLEGALAAAGCVLPGLILFRGGFATRPSSRGRPARWLRAGVAVAAVAVALVLTGSAWDTHLEAGRAQVRSSVQPADARADLAAQASGYAPVFNDLSLAQQQAVIAALTGAPPPAPAPDDLFTPAAAVRTGDALQVIAWLGPRMPEGEYHDQGTATTFVRLSPAGVPAPARLHNDPWHLTDAEVDHDALPINDAVWTGRYRMLSAPLSDAWANQPRVSVTLQRIRSYDGFAFDMTSLSGRVVQVLALPER